MKGLYAILDDNNFDYKYLDQTIINMKEVWEDEQVKNRNMNVKIDHPNLKGSQNIGVIAKLQSTPGKIKKPAPLYGEHTEEILKELNYTESEISDLIKNKIAGMK